MLVVVHPQSAENVRLRWGFLTIFYKYIIQQYFTVAAPNTAPSQYLKQIKYQMLVLVHPQSAENVRLQLMGFSNNILQIYNPAIFYCHRTSPYLLAIFRTNKISNTGSCTPTE